MRIVARAVYGALGGAAGAACMTVLRMAAHRGGVIDKTVAQSMEEWIAHRAGSALPADPVAHHVADQLLHYAYGSALGAAYGLAVDAERPASATGLLGRGVGLGGATWLLGSWALLPGLGAKPVPWRQRPSEVAIDLGAHLVFGLATALICGELAAQTHHRPTSDTLRKLTRIG